MAYSYVTYTGDGSTQIYTVPFPFIKQEDIHVFLDAEEVPAERIEWLSESSIKFDMPPEQGAVIRIRRDTDKEEAMVDFHDGSVLSEEDLDQNTRQLLFIAQEAYDALEGSPTIDNDNKWDMRGLPIKNVGPAEDPDDAVNYRQYSTDMLPTLQDLQQKTAQSEANAKASEVAAAQSRQAAATSQTAAKGSEADAKASKEAAAESARQAEDWTERAKAWAESPTPPDPDDPESKSAKEWAKAASDTVPIATPSIAGKVMPQTGDEDGLELGEDGSLRVRKATTTQRGSVLASTTAAANTVPQAGEDGTLDASWVPRPDCWDMFPPFVPVPIWGATPGGSDGRRAVMPGEEQAREEWFLCDGGSDGKDGTVPDLRGRYVRGASEAEPEGTEGGSEDVAVDLSGSTGATTLSTTQMPSHTHPFTAVISTKGGYMESGNLYDSGSSNTSATGGNGSHTHPLSGSVSGTHTDPHLAMNYFIKVV